MAEALKEMFNKKFYEQLALEFNKADKNFHPDKFVKDLMVGIDSMSLNQRLRNTTIMLKKHLPADYKRSVDILNKVAPKFQSHYTAFLFPDFVGQFGHDNVDLSLETLKYLTSFGSSEFAIREFLKRDFTKTLKVMNKWAEDKNHHVRRLASEGSRARLPWSFNLDAVIQNPSITKSILEKLKTDEELYVKKSVANHLNDFSKHHIDYLISILDSWDKTNEHTAWIVKHASRTLIKKGHPQSLALFNFEKNAKVKVKDFVLNKSKMNYPEAELSGYRLNEFLIPMQSIGVLNQYFKIKLGENLQFDFDIVSKKATSQKLVIDYSIYYVKKSGEVLPKVFKLREIQLKPKETVHISKSHRFQDFTTRKHYAGKHYIELLVNGKQYDKKEFILSV